MTKTDAENRLVRLSQIARVLDRVLDGGWIARPVAQKNPVYSSGEHFFRGRRGGKYVHLAAVGHEAPEDVPLDAEIVRADAQWPFRMRLWRQRKVRAYFGEILCNIGRPEK